MPTNFPTSGSICRQDADLKTHRPASGSLSLRKLHGMSLLTSRYEAELELLVFASWHGTKDYPDTDRGLLPPQSERVSHFRPALDFTRISILNTILCFAAILYGIPHAYTIHSRNTGFSIKSSDCSHANEAKSSMQPSPSAEFSDQSTDSPSSRLWRLRSSPLSHPYISLKGRIPTGKTSFPQNGKMGMRTYNP